MIPTVIKNDLYGKSAIADLLEWTTLEFSPSL